jgi:hypothetical protein
MRLMGCDMWRPLPQRSRCREGSGTHNFVHTPRVREINDALPGADLIREGLRDLENGVESVPALLVLVGAPRLRELGIDVVKTVHTPGFPEHRLYDRLAADDPDGAHSSYNALIRRLVSFERTAECVRD